MPSIDHNAKRYETNRAALFGFAVRTRRNALKLTASELSRRTADLGYPISRGAIAKIESDSRSGKIDVAEVLVLARALDIPPVLLLFPNISPESSDEVLPGMVVRNDDAVRWMAGQITFPQRRDPATDRLIGEPEPPNDGVDLLAASALLERTLETRITLVEYLDRAGDDPTEGKNTRRMLEQNAEQLAGLRQRMRDAREAMWGLRGSDDVKEGEGGN